ncbi:Hypothetical predicted protein, partial [Paramuricea clavata]
MIQIDTGAQCNILSTETYVRVTGDTELKLLKPCKKEIVSYTGERRNITGKVTLPVWHAGKKQLIKFTIIDGDYRPILSLDTSVALGIVNLRHCDILSLGIQPPKDPASEYKDVFDGSLGKIPDTYKIVIDSTVQPVVHPPRRVPVALRPRIKSELNKLVEREVIVPVTKPTQWVSSMLAVVKPNKIRICIDPRDLNRAICREHYQLPTVEVVTTRLTGAKKFTVCDEKDGFHQIQLDEDSSYLATFNTPFGRFRWTRLPFGISSAPEVWQRRMHEFVEGLDGVEVIDDFLIAGFGNTEEEVNASLEKNERVFFEKCREWNLKLNKSKLKRAQSSVAFMGHLLTPDGLKPDPAKVEAILEMPSPTDVKRFLGMVNYLAKFLPLLSDMTQPLRKLKDKDFEWCWLEQHEKAFKTVKDYLAKAPVLAYYDVNKEVTIQRPANSYALRALTETETRYAQIEKELLAIVWATNKFDQYILGREIVHIESDHQPLKAVFAKAIHKSPKRLQRMLMALQSYTLEIHYKKGTLMWISDTLSRVYRSTTESAEHHISEVRALEEINHCEGVSIAPNRLNQFKQCTSTDPCSICQTHQPEQCREPLKSYDLPQRPCLRLLKTCKSLLKKAKARGEDPLLALLDWRNTPTENIGTSPAQRLMGRRTRTLLPTHQSLLKTPEQNGTKKELENRKAKQARLYNKKCKPLEPLQSGCAIRMKLSGDNRWSLGTCVRALENRSFEVEVCGRRYRRNRRHLRATKEMAPPPNAKDSQIEPSEPIEKDLTPSLPVVEHSTPTNPLTHETENENQVGSSGSNGGQTPRESDAGQEESIPRRTTRLYVRHKHYDAVKQFRWDTKMLGRCGDDIIVDVTLETDKLRFRHIILIELILKIYVDKNLYRIKNTMKNSHKLFTGYEELLSISKKLYFLDVRGYQQYGVTSFFYGKRKLPDFFKVLNGSSVSSMPLKYRLLLLTKDTSAMATPMFIFHSTYICRDNSNLLPLIASVFPQSYFLTVVHPPDIRPMNGIFSEDSTALKLPDSSISLFLLCSVCDLSVIRFPSSIFYAVFSLMYFCNLCNCLLRDTTQGCKICWVITITDRFTVIHNDESLGSTKYVNHVKSTTKAKPVLKNLLMDINSKSLGENCIRHTLNEGQLLTCSFWEYLCFHSQWTNVVPQVSQLLHSFCVLFQQLLRASC